MRGGLVALTLWTAPADAAGLERLGTFIWDRPEDYFGGWSGIEVRDGGDDFMAIGDNAQVYIGRFAREDGIVNGVEWRPIGALADDRGTPLYRHPIPEMTDAEGLALLSDGRFAVSFEQFPRVMIYGGAHPEQIELPREAHGLPRNGGTEALAVDAEGRLVAIPETRPAGMPGFPVWRQTATGWETLFQIARTPGYAPVGADIGPDGWLYVLERAFRGVGFQSRIRRFEPDAADPDGEWLWTSPMLAYDNHEGLSAWRDADGAIRLTIISDDNYNWVQRTEIVEFRLTE